MITYLQAIYLHWPAVQCHSIGDGSVYEDIVWDAGNEVPAKELIDHYIETRVLTNTVLHTAAFRNRFTLSERTTLEIISIDDSTAALAQRQFAASVRAYLQSIEDAHFVDIQDPLTASFVNRLEADHFIVLGRAKEILETPPTQSELYTS